MAFLKFKAPVFLGGIKERAVSESNSATLPNYGASLITATSAATPFGLAAPGLGVRKTIICLNATTTNTAVVTCASGSYIYATTNVSTASDVMTFNADNEVIELMGVSTATWAVLSNNNGVAFS